MTCERIIPYIGLDFTDIRFSQNTIGFIWGIDSRISKVTIGYTLSIL